MTLRSIIPTFALLAVFSIPAVAQIPTVQVYSEVGSSVYHCGQPGTTQELIVVLRGVDEVVSAVDFMIQYPPSMTWLGDQLPDAGYISNEVITLGSSPTGIAVAWHTCCMQDAHDGLVVLRPLILWTGNCQGCVPIVVKGYAPLGKENPSYVRVSDFTEYPALGLPTQYSGCVIAVEPATWGKVKALYR